MKSNHTIPLNNITLPLAVERQAHAIRITQIQDDCTHMGFDAAYHLPASMPTAKNTQYYTSH
jgi:hypothetical protein